jgi:hypothetical protein
MKTAWTHSLTASRRRGEAERVETRVNALMPRLYNWIPHTINDFY